jgi:hypothetical protein
MRTTYRIHVNLDGDVEVTQTAVMSLEEYLRQAGEVHAFALRMRGYPITSAVPLLPPQEPPHDH